MRIQPIRIHREPTIEELKQQLEHHPEKPQPTFGWSIKTQTTRYGKSMVKLIEYHPDNGQRLIVVDKFYDGKQTLKTKELYNAKWQLVKRKIIEFVDGIKGKTFNL